MMEVLGKIAEKNPVVSAISLVAVVAIVAIQKQHQMNNLTVRNP